MEEWKKELLTARHNWYQKHYKAAQDFGTPKPLYRTFESCGNNCS
jgi:hypothetical protein